MSTQHDLNERQELFCRYYVRRPVGAEAARWAGYAPKGSAVQACRLLDRPEIKDRITALRADVARRHCRDSDALLAKLESVYLLAVEVHQFYAAAQALTLQARIAGLLPERGGARVAPPAAEILALEASAVEASVPPAPVLRNVNG